MKLLTTCIILGVITSGCADRQVPILTCESIDIDQHVGKMVSIEGIVENMKHPVVSGIGCWALEDYRGKDIRVTGKLTKHEVTEEMVKKMELNMVAHEGAGVFYELIELQAIIEK